MPERAPEGASRSEKSAEAVVAAVGRRAEREGASTPMVMGKARHQMPARAGRVGEGVGEAASLPASDGLWPCLFLSGLAISLARTAVAVNSATFQWNSS